ncbi:stage II sporulation protein P [Natranaerovirga pectinivora]|uniref:Stage II sporulation protein P n=1 Tax=Natranaerovirga pectinivora TaxID=682400 RepID=A0A4R3MRP7_9FIRM|nr:stage II sporulation protein P [Natranaerovirga pectinivora]TCT16868.1 stage II sporulation protein P [Natranaerovirga pectinivora]
MERRRSIQSIKKINVLLVLVMIILFSNILYKGYEIFVPDSFKTIGAQIRKSSSNYLSEQIFVKSVPLLSYTFNNHSDLVKQEKLLGYETSYFKRFFSGHIPLIDYVLKEESLQYYTVAEVYPSIEQWQQEDEGNKNIDIAELEEESNHIEKPIENHIVKSYAYTLEQLKDFNFLMNNMYTVDNSIRVSPNDFNIEKWLSNDITVDFSKEEPKVLIYHTHSQEAFIDSRKGFVEDTVVGLGVELAEILKNDYEINVIHHTGVYDYPVRDRAYANAVGPISRILEENPSIEIVIDLHRDGVPDHLHFVTEINGKQTARIMFFNGISKTLVNGRMVENGYIPNPYVNENMALTLQMQLKAAEIFPGFTRRIYLRGERFNLHLKPRSLLIEVGAQTNTVEEAKNAMAPLAQILYEVFIGH